MCQRCHMVPLAGTLAGEGTALASLVHNTTVGLVLSFRRAGA